MPLLVRLFFFSPASLYGLTGINFKLLSRYQLSISQRCIHQALLPGFAVTSIHLPTPSPLFQPLLTGHEKICCKGRLVSFIRRKVGPCGSSAKSPHSATSGGSIWSCNLVRRATLLYGQQFYSLLQMTTKA